MWPIGNGHQIAGLQRNERRTTKGEAKDRKRVQEDGFASKRFGGPTRWRLVQGDAIVRSSVQ